MTHTADVVPTGSPDGAHAVDPADDSMKMPVGGQRDYTDGRQPGDWDSHFPPEARKMMNAEACYLVVALILSLACAGVSLGLADQNSTIDVGGGLKLWISYKLLAIFSAGTVGGVTFSIKWLIHAAAKRKWHRDRRYWRLMVPLVGGVYACVVMTLFGAGIFAAQEAADKTVATTAALAFMVGYFSDGVSGLLSNVANAVFGTLEKK
ncbi:hypothetical protein [Sphingopyxis fribergensis]